MLMKHKRTNHYQFNYSKLGLATENPNTDKFDMKFKFGVMSPARKLVNNPLRGIGKQEQTPRITNPSPNSTRLITIITNTDLNATPQKRETLEQRIVRLNRNKSSV